MRQGRRTVQLLAVVATAGVLAAACGGSSGGGGGGGGGGNGGSSGSGKPIVVGTTDKVVSFDPSGSYDLGSFTPMYSMYQTLVRFDPGSTTPTPDAAQSCKFDNSTTYECTMRKGLKFWNGDPVTADAVVYSVTRNLKIAAPEGASSLLSAMKSVAAKGDVVTFTLKYPFPVFPQILTDPSNGIVDPKVFPQDKLLDSAKIVGSGPYKLSKYESGQQLVLVPNPNYGGDLKLKNKGVIVRYYSTASALKLDLEQGTADVGYRTFSPTDIKSLQGESSKGVEVVQGQGADIQYMVFNTKTQPGQTEAQKLAIRKAVAMSVDRKAIATSVFNDTVSPLYSMVPDALPGHTDGFKTAYGAAPSAAAKVKSTLTAAGLQAPVPLTIWWTPSHYGETSSDMYTNIKRQLESTGAFKVTLKSAEWDTYSKAYPTDQYPIFQLGWFPDYPDPDDYTNPFYASGKASFLNDHFSNPQIDALLEKERGTTDKATREKAFAQIQTIGAQQAVLVPLVQGKQLAVQRKGVTGVKETLDASYTFRYWLIGK